MSGEENLGNLRVHIHELDRKIICPCKAFIICEEHRTLNGLVAVRATARVKIYHVPPDVMQEVYDKCERVVTCTIGERQTAHFYAGDCTKSMATLSKILRRCLTHSTQNSKKKRR